ncbi:N-acyl homoserine lactonase family protein [Streptomyces sp. GbtcB6]|uniref:N-acyl homoserine lactonase family protein n=1 Tax=Streptomyces sp. GbtcB6 TaxID=2824751 RepID=UPI001C2FBC74|nr:N-acyl homoserine lactonase family protein [Streptomyces sp. GbtcB6]
MTRHGVRRVLPLILGWEELPRSVSVHGAPHGERVREPVPGVLLETEEGWLLLDTGFNAALLRDPELRRRYYPSPSYQPELPGPGEPLPAALAAVGVALEEITAVAVSHLHADHAGGLKHFAGRVPVHIQRAELEFGLSGRPEVERETIFRVDFDDPRIDWRLGDGDQEIVPGVTAVLSAGHTPGHQSFVVDLADGGGYVFTCDAADLTENIDEERPAGTSIGVPPEATLAPIRHLKRLAADKGYELVPGHDPVVWPELIRRLTDGQGHRHRGRTVPPTPRR